MTDQPQVINVHVQHLRRNGFANLRSWLDADPVRHVYIGRQCPYVDGATASVWQNPFPISKYGIDESLRLYESHIRTKLWGSLPELRGKILVAGACRIRPVTGKSCSGWFTNITPPWREAGSPALRALP